MCREHRLDITRRALAALGHTGELSDTGALRTYSRARRRAGSGEAMSLSAIVARAQYRSRTRRAVNTRH
jgi:hypothetical protein